MKREAMKSVMKRGDEECDEERGDEERDEETDEAQANEQENQGESMAISSDEVSILSFGLPVLNLGSILRQGGEGETRPSTQHTT
jgi:hypothetical protein